MVYLVQSGAFGRATDATIVPPSCHNHATIVRRRPQCTAHHHGKKATFCPRQRESLYHSYAPLPERCPPFRAVLRGETPDTCREDSRVGSAGKGAAGGTSAEEPRDER
jgi:hypothetical protein